MLYNTHNIQLYREMPKNTNSTFLYIMKCLVITFLILYIWKAIRQSNLHESYDNTHTTTDFSKLDIPLNQTLDNANTDTNGCEECSSAGNNTSITGAKLLPVMDPCFNMREVSKQCILLEDHLNTKGKDCLDCCKKHFLTIEALCEEAVGLDTDGKYPEIRDMPTKIRSLIKDFIKKKDIHQIAQDLRSIRKQCMKKYFNAF